ncbi:MAG TPA: hypothetical protein VGB99_05635 [Acidobacteriota bacterium]
MGLALLLLWVAAPPAFAAPTPQDNACLNCHSELEDELHTPVENWRHDVHFERGITCAGCHGGVDDPALSDDMVTTMDPDRGFVGRPERAELAEFCGRCHSDAAFMKRYNPRARIDQVAEYRSSVHGQKNRAGDLKVATCIDCHGVHGILPLSNPNSPVAPQNVPQTCAHCHSDAARMAEYGIPTDQFAEYSASVHAEALLIRQDNAAPACNDCHGNHGAVPPGVESIANVCGQCHALEATLFRGSKKKAIFDELGYSECAICHGHHEIAHPSPELLNSEPPASAAAGQLQYDAAFSLELEELAPGAEVEATYRARLAARERSPQDWSRSVSARAAGHDALTVALASPLGQTAPQEPLLAQAQAWSLGLSFENLSGAVVEPGDTLAYALRIHNLGAEPLRALRVEDPLAAAIRASSGSVCLECHDQGDACDQSTTRIYQRLMEMGRSIRSARSLLEQAAQRGMEVSGAQFELGNAGTSALIESRALIHTFDEPRIQKRIREGRAAAASARAAGQRALAELQSRRRGLMVSLLIIGACLVGLALKIRQLSQARSM